jgi:hypothetical protein
VLVLAQLGQPAPDALAQLAGRLLGEGEGEDRADGHAVAQHRLDEALDHDRGLAGPGGRGEQAGAGAVYQPLRGSDLRPRGAVREGDAAAGLVDTDVLEPGEWEGLLATLRAQAEDAAARMRAGDLRPCPERCTPAGCAYPGICRAGDGGAEEPA